ncbi:TcaA NTF2-like domain-containing protein [Staphylococcus equorum]|uniref:TcaA NTF2-like domain-containing protein n=1 Tax=Staphylococcus equorum TaxID=246432 RepID=UPI0008532141|nr:hypothetical protein [Staphylococcus equorum]OEL08261.1 hypothetical protein AST04_08735 [Staphylococcus equorum]
MSKEDTNTTGQDNAGDDELTEEEIALIEEANRKRKKWIIRITLLLIVIIIGVVVYIYASDKSAKGQIKDFEKAVNNRDYTTLIEMMKTNEKELTKMDMKHFVDYINKGKNKTRFNKEIDKMLDNVDAKDNYDVSMGQITDNNGNAIVKANKDGSRFLFLNKLAFQPQFYTAVIDEGNNKTKYEYEEDGKSHKILASANQDNEMGKVFVGDYEIDAVKSFDDATIDGKINGQLHVNTDNLNKDNQVVVKDEFSQSWFKVKLENTEKLDDNYTLLIDGNEVDYDKDKVYGKFPADIYFTLSAKGRMNDAQIKTNEVEVNANEKDKPQELKLKFDQKSIDKQVEKEKVIEKDAKKFLEKYTDKLNTAYKVSDFSALKRFFEDDESDVAKNIEKQVKSKKETQFKKPKFKSYNRSDGTITIVLTKKDDDKNTITSQYKLSYDEEKEEFKIKEYTDV